jgi:hypothetical protein
VENGLHAKSYINVIVDRNIDRKWFQHTKEMLFQRFEGQYDSP